MNDWLDAAAEVGGALVAVCVVIFLVVLLDWVRRRRMVRRMCAAYRYRRTIGHGRLNCLRYVLSPSYRRTERWLR